MVLDMGLSAVLVQFAAREFIGLSWGVGGKVEGGTPSRFLTLTQKRLGYKASSRVLFTAGSCTVNLKRRGGWLKRGKYEIDSGTDCRHTHLGQ